VVRAWPQPVGCGARTSGPEHHQNQVLQRGHYSPRAGYPDLQLAARLLTARRRRRRLPGRIVAAPWASSARCGHAASTVGPLLHGVQHCFERSSTYTEHLLVAAMGALRRQCSSARQRAACMPRSCASRSSCVNSFVWPKLHSDFAPPLLRPWAVLPLGERMQPCRVRASANVAAVTRCSACRDRGSTTVARQRVRTASWVRTRGHWVGTVSTARGSFDGLPVGVFGQPAWGATSKLAHVRPRIWSGVPIRYMLCVGPAAEAVYGHR